MAPIRSPAGANRLTQAHFAQLVAVAHELGFQSISYDDLAAWLWQGRALAGTSDHVRLRSSHEVPCATRCFPVLDRYGYTANLFINTGLMGRKCTEQACRTFAERQHLLWEEAAELAEAGWQIGAHTVTHPNLSELSAADPTGERLRAELEKCDADDRAASWHCAPRTSPSRARVGAVLPSAR